MIKYVTQTNLASSSSLLNIDNLLIPEPSPDSSSRRMSGSSWRRITMGVLEDRARLLEPKYPVGREDIRLAYS